ncbi:MAG: hypothetical protein K2Y39_16860 [Candidatus Obscuribacterales bacterium]|nr:hypothetical protein [Candidatus Obscuribacterales bacterium]
MSEEYFIPFNFSDGQDIRPETEKPLPIKIGDLLVQSTMIDEETLESCMGLAVKMHVPLGRILSMEGHLAEELLARALEVQDLIVKEVLSVNNGVMVLKLVKQQALTIEEAVARVNALPTAAGVKASRLGDLLRESAAAQQKQIEKAIIDGINASLPLGQVLLNRGIITIDLLNSALLGLRIIRDGVATRSQVLQALRAARLRKLPLLQPLLEMGAVQEDPYPCNDIGYLMYLSGLINERELISAREIEVTEDKTVEQALISCGFCSEKSVTALNELLNMLMEGALQEEQAIQLTKKLEHVDWDISQVLQALEEQEDYFEEELEVAELLKVTGCIHPEDLEVATQKSLKKRQSLAASLLESGFMTQMTLDGANTLKSLVEQKILDLEQARTLLAYIHENDVDIASAIKDFDWLPAAMS